VTSVAGETYSFGSTGVAQGFCGLIRATAGTSATPTLVKSGADLTYGIGDWNHLLVFALEYGETEAALRTKKFFATYETSRYFTERFCFESVHVSNYDGTLVDDSGTVLPGSDAFLGFGPGYRVINTWTRHGAFRVAPGVRYFKQQVSPIPKLVSSLYPHGTSTARPIRSTSPMTPISWLRTPNTIVSS
jgi:putative salt-induced outer membrane protein